jgi:O-succinylbenzoate synthase
VAIGLASDPGEVTDEVEGALAAGARLVVLKVRPGWSVAPLAAVRRACPEVAVAVDANGSFALGDLDELRALDAEGPAFVEQPLPAGDLEGSAQVAAALTAPIALDEGVTTVRDLAAAVSVEAGSVLTVKPARVGGHRIAAELVARAHRAGWEVHVGGMLESGLGRAAARHLAARPEVRGPALVGPTGLLFGADVVDPVAAGPDGLVPVPTGPGLAPPPDPDRLAELTLDRWDARR